MRYIGSEYNRNEWLLAEMILFNLFEKSKKKREVHSNVWIWLINRNIEWSNMEAIYNALK